MLVAPCIKLFTDGLGIFKKYIVKINDFLSNLIFIYFHYSSIAESQELQRINNNKSGILHMLPEFNQQSETTKKRMKQTLIKLVFYKKKKLKKNILEPYKPLLLIMFLILLVF